MMSQSSLVQSGMAPSTRGTRRGTEEDMSLRIQSLCIDTTEPAALAAFWEHALGWRRTYDEPDEVVLEAPEGSREEGVVPD